MTNLSAAGDDLWAHRFLRSRHGVPISLRDRLAAIGDPSSILSRTGSVKPCARHSLTTSLIASEIFSLISCTRATISLGSMFINVAWRRARARRRLIGCGGGKRSVRLGRLASVLYAPNASSARSSHWTSPVGALRSREADGQVAQQACSANSRGNEVYCGNSSGSPFRDDVAWGEESSSGSDRSTFFPKEWTPMPTERLAMTQVCDVIRLRSAGCRSARSHGGPRLCLQWAAILRGGKTELAASTKNHGYSSGSRAVRSGADLAAVPRAQADCPATVSFCRLGG